MKIAPGQIDRLLYIGWEAKGKIEFEAALERFKVHGVEFTVMQPEPGARG